MTATLSFAVVTPSYNQGRFIGRTLCSVLDQLRPGDEFVVMDGGSTDETVELLRRHESKVRWVSEKDRGQADAVNKGIRVTKGDIIGWLNSDDIYYPGTLDAVRQYFESHPEIDVVYGDAYHIDENDAVLEPYYTEPWNPKRLQDVCFLCQPAVFFRRRVVERFGLLDDSLQYCLDYEFWLRLVQRGAKFGFLGRPLAGSRLYATNKTLGSRVKVHYEINQMMHRLLGQVPERWIFNYAHAVLEAKSFLNDRKQLLQWCVLVHSWLGSLRWNRSVSFRILSMMRDRLNYGTRSLFKKVISG